MYRFESLSLRKNRMQMKENPCKLTIYGDFLFLVHSKNKHIKAFFRCTTQGHTTWRHLQYDSRFGYRFLWSSNIHVN